MSIHIVLVEPEIPPNTGNIARSCAATGSVLHLVKPLGFSIDDKTLKRAGLDYWPYVRVEVHESLEKFMEKFGPKCQPAAGPDAPRIYLATTKGVHRYDEAGFADGDMILFGRETSGLPREFIAEREALDPGCSIRIPMSQDTRLRSLNISNSVAIVLFEALRQLDFPMLK
ncbi:MAG: tRNA (cytidine(34)-2'-O)-methyltransferase [Eubacteriales bacterium]|nr:tRNA (cytidine(34)-2'-O)-methyltransferase [Eubacteriales bacterium]